MRERRVVTSLDLQKWPRLTDQGPGEMAIGEVQIPSGKGHPVPLECAYLEFNDPHGSGQGTHHCYALSHSGEVLAASWRSTEITIWRLTDGRTLQRLGEDGHTAGVTAVAFSPNDKYLVSGSADRVAIVWDVRSGRVMMRLEGHSDAISDVTYSPDGRWILTASSNYDMKIWDATSGAPLGTYSHSSPARRILFSIDGSRFAVVLRDTVALYDAGTPVVQLSVIWLNHHRGPLTVALSPQGDRVLICPNSRSARVYDTDSGRELLPVGEHESEIRAGAFAPDGVDVAVVLFDGTMNIRDSRNRTEGHTHTIGSCGNAVAYSPDGIFIAAAGVANVIVRNAKSGELIADFWGTVPHLAEIKWLPDSRRVLSTAGEGPLCVWNVGDTLRLR